MVTTINPAECDRTTVYTGECRNFQDTEWITFDSGRRRSPNAHDGNTWLLDVGYGSFWMRDDQVRNLVRLVPAREVTRDDQPDDLDGLWETFRDRFKAFDGYRSESHQHSLWTVFRSGIQYGETRFLDHLNANGGLPASREDAALADRLERQAATISELQGCFLCVERDAARWRRAHSIVEAERDQARESLRRLRDETDFDLFTVRDQLKQCRGERKEMTRDRDEWRERAEAAEARTAPAVTRKDVEKVVHGSGGGFFDERLDAITDAVWHLVSGDDPAMFVVRESDVASVNVERHGGGGMETTMFLGHLEDNPSVVRDPAANYLQGLAETEALARAIEAEQTVDPVTAKAEELFKIANPTLEWAWASGPNLEAYRRMARHVLEKEDRHDDQ